MTITERLDALVDAVRDERRRPGAERTTGPADAALDGAVAHLVAAREAIEAGRDAGGRDQLRQLAHSVVDSWSYSSTLAREIVRVAQDADPRP